MEQQIAAANINFVGNFIGPKVSDFGVDATGKIYDMSNVRLLLQEIPLAYEARNSRCNEGEFREWVYNKLRLITPAQKTPLLLMHANSKGSEIIRNTHFDQVSVAVVKEFQKRGLEKTYCDVTGTVLQLLDKAKQEQHSKNLQLFFRYICMHGNSNVSANAAATIGSFVRIFGNALLEMAVERSLYMCVEYKSAQAKKYLQELERVLGNDLVQVNHQKSKVMFPSFWLKQLDEKAIKELSTELQVEKSTFRY